MTPETLDAELDRLRQELIVIGLNVRAQVTSIDLLRGRLAHELTDPDCPGCVVCSR